MTQTVILCEDILAPDSWERHDVHDVRDFLMSRFDHFPATARIYHGQVSQDRDVTPSDEAGVERLATLDGTLYVVVYPGDPITIIVAVVAVAAAAAVAFLLMPSVPNAALRNTQSESPNNELSDRQNRPRPNGRIPDIYGTVRSTPDLLAVPYKVFEDHEEVEYAFMCVGRGEYDVPSAEVKDGDTRIQDIAGASVEVFAPGTSPNSGDDPQLRIGTAIDEPVYRVTRSNAVNGQTLRAPNADSFTGASDVRFAYPDEIQAKSGADIDFTRYFASGDTLTISSAVYVGEIQGSGVDSTETVRFTDDGTLEFETGNTDAFATGDVVTVTGATYLYSTAQPGVYEDFSGGVGNFTAYSGGSSLSVSASALTVAYTSGSAYGARVPTAAVLDNTVVTVVFNLVSISGLTTDIRVGMQGGGSGWASNNVTISSAGQHTVELTLSRDASNATLLFYSPHAGGSFVIDTVVALVGGGIGSINLSGTYLISGKTSSALTLSSPEDVNSDWGLIGPNFSSGHTLYKDCALVVPSGITTLDLAGTYSVLSVSTGTIVLSSPSTVNSDWALLDDLADDRTDWLSPVLETSGDKWVGPFVLDNVDQVFSNFVALNGLYKDDGERQRRFDVVVELELTPVDINDTPTGSAETFQSTVEGSETSRTTRAATQRAEPTFSGRCSVRARRVTDSDLDFKGTVVDEIKWRDLYAVLDIDQDDFGNVTTVQSVTYATAGALAVKDRKLNMLVTRKVPVRVSGTTFGVAMATNRVDDILAAVCLDPYIGGRELSELDLDSIYDTVAEAEDYFGSSDQVEFCYTFDNDNMSFEETVSAIASAVFCTAYRQGSLIRLKLERSTEDSALLFNHRNKLPGSETRTIRFGNQDENDGVEYSWVDPKDDALVTFYLPYDQSASNPRKVESIGVRNYAQAFQHAHRVWNKVRYQNVATDFEATQEAELLVLTDRILVADNTRPGTQDGQVEAQEALELELSQEVEFESGKDYVIFLQHVDGSVESLGVSPGSGPRRVLLDQAPRAALALDETYFAKATYQVVKRDDRRPSAFLLIEREPMDRMTSAVKAVNYDHAYYMQEGLALWIKPDVQGLEDAGPARHSVGAAAGATLAVDSTRGQVYEGTNATAILTPSAASLTASASYTKAMWVKKAADGLTGNLLGSASSGPENLFIQGSTGQLLAGHNTSFNAVGAEAPDDVWFHVALTYNASDGAMRLYIDGQLMDEAIVAQRTLGPLLISGYNGGNALQGQMDDVRLYSRALTAHEVLTVYRKTLL